MNQTQAFEQALRIIKQTEVVMLTTLTQSAQPDTRAMLNLRNPNQFAPLQSQFPDRSFDSYLSTNLSSEKMQQAADNPNASLYYFNPSSTQGVTLLGTIYKVTQDTTLDAFWLPGWEMYYPGGRHGGDYALLHFIAQQLKFYDGAFGVHSYALAH